MAKKDHKEDVIGTIYASELGETLNDAINFLTTFKKEAGEAGWVDLTIEDASYNALEIVIKGWRPMTPNEKRTAAASAARVKKKRKEDAEKKREADLKELKRLQDKYGAYAAE